MLNYNLITDTDSYKASHYVQFPPGTEGMHMYLQVRRSIFPIIIPFGFQYGLQEYLSEPITQDNIEEAADIFPAHGLPFNRRGWEYVLNRYDGYLPLIIRSVPEGTPLPAAAKPILATVRCEDKECSWLGSYIEDIMSRIWYPTAVASLSYAVKSNIKYWMEKTCDTLQFLPFKLHDFGARGASSLESARIGGLAHLVNFLGTDTVEALRLARMYYHNQMAGFSIPAAEHSTMTSWGRNYEVAAYRNMLQQFAKPGKLLAVVSDSYDINHATEEIWGKRLKQEVIESGAKIIVRPDSGDPIEGTIAVAKSLANSYGYDENTKGYNVIRNTGVIWGDALDPLKIELICQRAAEEKLSLDNFAFGMGAGLLQKVNRDDVGFGYKASAIKISGQWTNVSKDPIGDKTKKSQGGLLTMINKKGEYIIEDERDATWSDDSYPVLETTYSMGKCYSSTNLDKVRKNTKLW